MALKAEEPAQHGSTAPLTNIRWSHRLLAPLNDPVLGDLAGTRFRGYYRFAGSPPESDAVLAWIDDAVPGIIERSVGAGRVLLFNTTAGDDWSDLPRRKSFVPLVDRVLTYLSAGGARRDFPVGETVTLPLADWKAGETLSVRGPGGANLTPTFASAGGRNLLRLGPLMEPGVYRVERPDASGKSFPFVVNVGTADSTMTPADPATLSAWFAPATIDVLDPEAAGKQLAWSTAEVTLWPWLVGLGRYRADRGDVLRALALPANEPGAGERGGSPPRAVPPRGDVSATDPFSRNPAGVRGSILSLTNCSGP